MTRQKMWFLTSLSECYPPGLADKLLMDIGFDSNTREVLLKRFWKGQPIKSVGILSLGEQRRNIAKWNCWARNWCIKHPNLFTPEQRLKLEIHTEIE